ncbi:putative DNA topoisomerase, type IA, central region, subdomain 1 [Medicago truncatula]|uniref:Putative DNA topoisomerase, type IA, central region, subdomain 1 n=1 Tax=Medicago truncatula TaxID=3880 RepID=A0A396JEW0_MEDTR|nr:putative DNA topoisomerase, type IA, central region, subdomain 1 [Medicago truncatula]
MLCAGKEEMESFNFFSILSVKKLEDLGIGRPSTYASTLKVLKVFDLETI